MLKEKYGKGRKRKTRIQLFEDIEATKVAIRNTKLYVNRNEGFIGTSLKKDEYVADCSDIDDIICFTEDGTMMVTKVESKTFIGKNILYVGIFKKKDKRTIYNLIYKDGKIGYSHMKRFAVTSMTRDKAYNMGNDKPGTKILYFSCNPNGEAELVTVFLRQKKGLERLKFDINFSDLDIRGKNLKGDLVSKIPIKSVEFKEEGVSTLKPRKIWFDETVRRLNVDERGKLLGAFKGEDRLLVIRQNGIARTIVPELTTRFENDIIVVEKWNSKKPISLVYWEGEKEKYYVKRFQMDNADKDELVITEHPNSQLKVVSTNYIPRIEIEFKKPRGKERRSNEIVNLEDFISVKGIKAQGNQLTSDLIKQIQLIDPLHSDKESDDFIVPDTEGEKEDNQRSFLFD
jgi:topoisomerase-4 subunit A